MDERIFLYQQSIERVMNESIILGLSIREDFGFVKELGSHSLLVGIFYKNGLIGLFILLLFIIITCQPFLKSLFNGFRPVQNKINSKPILCLFPAMIPLYINEDFDSSGFVAFIFFLCVGYIMGFKRNDLVR